MARTIEYKRFATGPGANIEDQATFNVDEALVSGVQAGTAKSALANKVWRQSSFWAELLATFISQQLDVDQLDDNDLTAKLLNYGNALGVYIQTNVIFQKFLTTNLDLYVGGVGANDTNPGTAIAPFATLGRAVTEISKYNTNGFTISVHCQGAFSSGLSVGSIAGTGSVVFIFAAGSSITVATGACIQVFSGGSITINGPVTLSATMPSPFLGSDGVGVYAATGATVGLTGGPLFGACTAAHIGSDSSSVVAITGSYTIEGNSGSHYRANAGGLIAVANDGLPLTVSIIGTPSFSVAFATIQALSILRCHSGLVGFSGAATGQRYSASENAIIETNGGGATFLPGNTGGAVSSGGQYV